MESKSPKSQAQFAFLMSAFALVLAITGFVRVQDEGGGALWYLIEVGLPVFLFAGLLWHGFSLRRKNDRAV